MTESEKQQLELLTLIAELLAKLDARQDKWERIGMPEVRTP